MTNMKSQRVNTPDDISWHVEIFHPESTASAASKTSVSSASPSVSDTSSSSRHIVLIPSGEGDCGSQTTVASLLSSPPYSYTVVTFDMPGLSRTTAPKSAITNVNPQLLAKQIIALLDALHIDQATFFGCSSGGSATLTLAALYPSRVKCGIVHEVPLDPSPEFNALLEKSDEEITATLQFFFGKLFIEQDENGGPAKWEALGSDYHMRLSVNYPKFIRGYTCIPDHIFAGHPENLKRRPIFWTVGGLREGAERGEGDWKTGFEIAKEAGLEVNIQRLRCAHFPTVTIPEETAAWIDECVSKVEMNSKSDVSI